MKKLSQTNFEELFMEKGGLRVINGVVVRADLCGANKTFEEAAVNESFFVNASAKGYSFDDDSAAERCFKSFIAATSSYLSRVKVAKEDEAVALVLTDTAGVFKFAGIVEYHENETNDQDEPGNWSYIMTFNEADVEEIASKKKLVKHLYGEEAFKLVFDKVAYDVGGIQFEHEMYMYDSCLLCIDTLIGVLDKEANDADHVDIELVGYFVASAEVEDGEKVFAITPDGAMKKIIKSDITLSK